MSRVLLESVCSSELSTSRDDSEDRLSDLSWLVKT